MSRIVLKNFCLEPTQRDCSCTRDIRCGGIITPSDNCGEHGNSAAPAFMLKTHFHPVHGQAVGTARQRRYDDIKAS